MTKHAMIDIETIDTKPSAIVLTVGGVKFNPYDDEYPKNDIYYKIDIDQQNGLGRSTSESTLEWWAKQDQEAQEEAFSEDDRVSVEDFQKDLAKWVRDVDLIWGHGYGFDMTILTNLFQSAGLPVPWNFWVERDTRTVFSLLDEDPRNLIQNNKHNAYWDAYYQAMALKIAFRQLNVYTE